MVALFLPEILTPAGTLTAPDFTVPLITIVVPFAALLIAVERDVPLADTSIVLPVVVELLEELELEELELLELLEALELLELEELLL